MKFLSKLLGHKGKSIRIEEWKDDRESIESLWIEDISVSDNGLWVVVGRRHGILQLYRWDGERRSFPHQPTSNTVTQILHREGKFFLCMPPYITIFRLDYMFHPEKWTGTRIGGEGSRPAGAIGFFKNLLLFNTTNNYIKGIIPDGSGGKDFILSFPYREDLTGSLKAIGEFMGAIALMGEKGVAIYSDEGELIKHYNIPAGRSAVIRENTLYLHDGKHLYTVDKTLEEKIVADIEFPSSNMDIPPSLRYIFLSSQEDNRMVIYDLEEEHLEELGEFGYYIVKVSPDGSVFTCRKEGDERTYLYKLIRLEIFPEKKNTAKSSLGSIKININKATSKEELERIEKYIKESIVSHISRTVRNNLIKLYKDLEEKRVLLILKEKEAKIKDNRIDERDLKEVENLIHRAETPLKEKLEILKSKITENLLSSYKREIEEIRTDILKGNIYFYRDIRNSPKIDKLIKLAGSISKDKALEGDIKRAFIQAIWERYQIRIYNDKAEVGKETIERFPSKGKILRWHLRTEVTERGNGIRRYIYFERDDGFIAEPRRFNPEIEGEKLPSWVSKYLKHLNNLATGDRDYEFKGFEPTPWFVRNLELIIKGLKDQKEMGEGILILEGDAGTGKNFLIETLSRLTNRPLFIIPCHSQMEKDELTYVYEYNPKVGTKKRYSELIRALRTEGAIIYFDEINTLPYSIVKMLNPLFDYRRSLIMPSGEIIKSNDVLLLGSMNPQHYIGVNELPQDVKSRAEILYIDYPPFSEDNIFFHCDEAMILRSHIPSLKDLKSEDFYLTWHKVVNKVDFDIEVSKDRERIITDLMKLLGIIDRIRYHYKLYQSNKSEEPVNYVFSIRDSIRCVRKWVKGLDIRSAVKETVIPKIGNLYEREIMDNIISEDIYI